MTVHMRSEFIFCDAPEGKGNNSNVSVAENYFVERKDKCRVLTSASVVSAAVAKRLGQEQYAKCPVRQDGKLESNFMHEVRHLKGDGE